MAKAEKLSPYLRRDVLAERPSFEMPYGMAWLLQLTAALRDDDSRLDLFQSLVQAHLDGGLRNTLEDDYMISHWVPSFVLYVLSQRGLSTATRQHRVPTTK